MDDPKAFNAQIIEEFRENGGKVGGMFDGTPLLLLTSKGVKSGQKRIAPLAYTRDGDRYVVIASRRGAPRHPDWYYNLKSDPNVTIEVGSQSQQAVANEETGEERDRLYDQMANVMPGFAEYQRGTDRVIPLFTLSAVNETA